MKKKERMKIYTLLLGALFVSPTQAQTMHDWENHHVLQINREPARAAFTPFSVQKGDGSISLDGTWKFRWTPVPNERVMNFYQTNFNDKDWTDFPVPANWEVLALPIPQPVSLNVSTASPGITATVISTLPFSRLYLIPLSIRL